ncbi:MAG: transporter [Pseudomonadota bacterium]
MRKSSLGAAFAVAATLTSTALTSPASADDRTIAKDHAPIGVMGDHLHKKGEVMFSYRFMRMRMEGSRIGTDPVSPETIATTVPNRFFGSPMQPPTLRVVPLEMNMDMHMVGMMYAPTDWVTLMVMGMLVDKGMDHVTFQGPMGTTELGNFRTESSGFGDTSVSALVRLLDLETGGVKHKAHFNAGFSIPTGSVIETDDVLTPLNTRPTLRLPYPMQLGSGTVDLRPGVTYSGATAAFSWGAQYIGTFRTGTNDEDYTFGDRHDATAWAAYGPAPWWSLSARAAFTAQGSVDGIDQQIVAPVQTANPDFQGGDRFDLGVGLNFAGQSGVIEGHRVAVEVMFPVAQDLNGPQLETDWTLTVGWQKTF